MQYGYSPFCNNATLAKAHFGNPVTAIQSYLFCGCKSLNTFQYNSNCKPTAIENYAFAGGCKALTSYDIPETVTSLGTGVFKDCEKLGNIVIHPSVKSIGNYAFNGCTSLTGVVFEESEESLSLGYNEAGQYSSNQGKGMFYDCPLESVFIGRMLSYRTEMQYGYSPFAFIKTLKAFTIENVTSIGAQLLRSCTGIESLTIPEGVTNIGKSAFIDCSGLTEMAFPSTLKTMDSYVFYGCSSLTEMTIPTSVTSIGSYSFNGCTGITKLVIEDSEETLSLGYAGDSGNSSKTGSGMFIDCPLESIYLGRTITYEAAQRYGNSPFAFIKTLKTFTIANVTSIGTQLIRSCTGIESLTIPEGVTSIGKSAFIDCSGLTEITLPSTLKKMDTYVFYGCSSLTEMTIPGSVTSIGSYSFNGCTGITKLVIEDSEETLSLGYAGDSGSGSKTGSGMFVDCPLESLYLGRSVSYETAQRYGYSPFLNKESLANLVVGNDVKAIGMNQFWGCTSLKSVWLPATLKSIYTSSFGNCSSLEQLVCLALYPPTMNGNTSFMSGTVEGSRVYVFNADTYKATKGWSSSYATITSLGTFDADFTYNGHVQQITYDTSFPIYLSNLETMVDAGTYTKTIELDYEHNGETYHNSFPYEYTIKMVALTVTADDQTRVYGEENPEFTISYAGFVNNEDESALSTTPVVATKATAASNAGTYALTVSGGEATNYSFNYVNGTLTIEKAAQEITWEVDDTELEVGDVIVLEATVSSGLTLTYTTSDTNILPLSKKDGKVRATCKAAGEATITVTQSGTDNYLPAEPVSYTFYVVPTVIEEILQNEEADAQVYDLQGHPVQTPQNGFYIVNGKKVYFK